VWEAARVGRRGRTLAAVSGRRGGKGEKEGCGVIKDQGECLVVKGCRNPGGEGAR